ncbi:MAG TPA: hypothetical protein VN962_22450 [Polyangia bacterium]|nr:hypothetical protein [Polyangia bacterium]
MLAGILGAMYGLAVVVARSHAPDPTTSPYMGKRGASLSKSAGLLIRYRRGEEVRAVNPQTLLRAGDVLDFKVRADGPTYLEVRFKDGTAAPQTLFPTAGTPTTPAVAPGQALPTVAPIGPSAGKVVVTAIFSDRPRPVGVPADAESRPTTAVIGKE